MNNPGNSGSSAEPSAESLREMPEIDFSRARCLGRGNYADRITGQASHVVVLDDDLWPHFGSSERVNAALRLLVETAREATREYPAEAGERPR